MLENVKELKQSFDAALSSAEDTQPVENQRREYLGKKVNVTGLLKNMRDLSGEEKKSFGQQVN